MDFLFHKYYLINLKILSNPFSFYLNHSFKKFLFDFLITFLILEVLSTLYQKFNQSEVLIS